MSEHRNLPDEDQLDRELAAEGTREKGKLDDEGAGAGVGDEANTFEPEEFPAQ